MVQNVQGILSARPLNQLCAVQEDIDVRFVAMQTHLREQRTFLTMFEKARFSDYGAIVSSLAIYCLQNIVASIVSH